MPGDSGVTCMLVCALPLSLHTRPRAHRAPGIPCALFFGESATTMASLAQKTCGEIAKPCTVISPPSTRLCAWRGPRRAKLALEVGGGGSIGFLLWQRVCRGTPHPRPLRASFARLDPTASRRRGETVAVAIAGCLKIELSCVVPAFACVRRIDESRLTARTACPRRCGAGRANAARLPASRQNMPRVRVRIFAAWP
jgi:hypothetical protein